VSGDGRGAGGCDDGGSGGGKSGDDGDGDNGGGRHGVAEQRRRQAWQRQRRRRDGGDGVAVAGVAMVVAVGGGGRGGDGGEGAALSSHSCSPPGCRAAASRRPRPTAVGPRATAAEVRCGLAKCRRRIGSRQGWHDGDKLITKLPKPLCVQHCTRDTGASEYVIMARGQQGSHMNGARTQSSVETILMRQRGDEGRALG
jgi:hypothetical protein